MRTSALDEDELADEEQQQQVVHRCEDDRRDVVCRTQCRSSAPAPASVSADSSARAIALVGNVAAFANAAIPRTQVWLRVC